MDKYISGIVKIIYRDQHGKFTKRRIAVREVRGGVVRAYCMELQAPRIFLIDRIIAAVPEKEGMRA